MKNSTHRISLGKAIGVALGGIILSGVVTAIVFMGWFYFREVIMGNRDNLFALAFQSIACLTLFLIGIVSSVVCAVRLWKGQNLIGKKE